MTFLTLDAQLDTYWLIEKLVVVFLESFESTVLSTRRDNKREVLKEILIYFGGL